MHTRVKRTLFAGVVAPFSVYPVVFVVLSYSVSVGDSSWNDVLSGTGVIGTFAVAFALPFSLVIGVPVYRLLERAGRNSWFVSGLFGVGLGGFVTLAIWDLVQESLVPLVIACSCGAAVGLSFRAIAGTSQSDDFHGPDAT